MGRPRFYGADPTFEAVVDGEPEDPTEGAPPWQEALEAYQAGKARDLDEGQMALLRSMFVQVDDYRPTTLYRFFDGSGVLLYVGISFTALQRFTQHAGDKGWWQEVASATFEHFDTIREAADAEWQAIGTESPRYNRMGLPKEQWAETVPKAKPRPAPRIEPALIPGSYAERRHKERLEIQRKHERNS